MIRQKSDNLVSIHPLFILVIWLLPLYISITPHHRLPKRCVLGGCANLSGCMIHNWFCARSIRIGQRQKNNDLSHTQCYAKARLIHSILFLTQHSLQLVIFHNNP